MFQDTWALVVESDAHHLVAITAILKELGIHYKRNTTGSDVAGQAQTMQPQPSFILLDMDLPDADPFAVCQSIRAPSILENTPIIATGGIQWAQRQPQMKKAGFAGFICKPFPRKQLGSLLRCILDGETIWDN